MQRSYEAGPPGPGWRDTGLYGFVWDPDGSGGDYNGLPNISPYDQNQRIFGGGGQPDPTSPFPGTVTVPDLQGGR